MVALSGALAGAQAPTPAATPASAVAAAAAAAVGRPTPTEAQGGGGLHRLLNLAWLLA